MRILHVPYSFYPDPAGGTEVYVRSLAVSQRALGCQVAVAAPASATARYDHDDLPVWRFAISPKLSLSELYGEGDPIAARAFAAVLDEFQPDIVHLHALTSAISVRLSQQAKQRGCSVVFNYHTPTVSCGRGTLLKWGTEICDGSLNTSPCAACVLTGKGMAPPLAKFVSALPSALGDTLAFAGLSGGIFTALRIPQLTLLRNRAFHGMMQSADRIVTLCNWTRELLLRNGVPESKLTLCRQGISWTPGDGASISRPAATLPLRAVFLGRMDETKGPHIIIEALANNPDLPLHLDLFGVLQGDSGNHYAQRLRSMIAGDPRINLLPAIPSDNVTGILADYDLVLVPSQCLETGPLVVLEAFAARTPVIGSNLGGIAELVTHGVDGLLINPAASSLAWAEALHRICKRPALLDSLRAAIRSPRHIRDAALELMPVYQNIQDLKARPGLIVKTHMVKTQ